jgi:hypothetical protein
MSEILSNIVVQQINATFTAESTELSITPEAINLNYFGGGLGIPGGNAGEIQFNAGGFLGGNANMTYDSNTGITVINSLTANSISGNYISSPNLTIDLLTVTTNANLGAVGNITILGGSNGQFLATDGAGNLSFTSLFPNSITNGTSNVDIPSVNSNVTIGVAGNPNILVATSTGIITPSISTANITANSNVTLGTVGNVHIAGGTNGYFLQTDGAGNLSWAVGANATGNGTPGGSNTQIQYNDGGITFGGSAGFTFDKVSNVFSVPGDIYAPTGDLNIVDILVNGISNLGPVSNVTITGGNSGEYLTTDGNGTLSFSTVTSGKWSNVANIVVNDLLFGYVTGAFNTIVGPGNTLTTSTTFDFANGWYVYNPNVSGDLTSVKTVGNTITGKTLSGGNVVVTSNDGLTWTSYATTINPKTAPVKSGSNYIIFATGTNVAARSTNLSSWSNVALPNSGSWNDIAVGTNSVVICTSQSGYSNVARSTNDGVSYSAVSVGAQNNWTSVEYGNSTYIMVGQTGTGSARRSTDEGATWANITLPSTFSNAWRDVAYGDGKWIAVAAYTGGSNAQSAVSTNNGNTWTAVNLGQFEYNEIVYTGNYFVTTALASGRIAYSTDGTSWTTNSNIGTPGGHIAYNPGIDQVIITSVTGNANIALNQPVTINVTSNDGNTSNAQQVPTGSYRNLGGALGDAGAMWIRTA